MPMLHILKLQGIDDSDKVNFMCGYTSQGTPKFHMDGIMSIIQYLEHPAFKVQNIILGGKRSIDIDIKRPQLIFNSICDPDNNSKSLEVAHSVAKNLVDVPIVNHPQQIKKTTRDNIYALCKNIDGLNVPLTLRVTPHYISDIEKVIDEKKIQMPFIFRPAGGQGGIGMIRIENKNDLHLLEQFAFDGRDYYMIAYVNFISKDKLYRKYRYFVIAGKTYPGHLIVSDGWNIHGDDQVGKTDLKRLKEEKDFLKKWDRQLSVIFKEVYQKIGLDYFGIDCGIDSEGKIVIFEINACMNIFSLEKELSYYTPKYKKSIQNALIEMFYEKARR
jgi:glutathione synthase/RimK-type ligase-like ATP-grasp enzyme